MKKNLKNKIKTIYLEYKKIKTLIINKNQKIFNKNLNKKYNKFKIIINYYLEWKKYKKLNKEALKCLKIKDLKELAEEDIKKSKERSKFLKNKIKNLIKNKVNKINNIFIEIKIGVGGEESAIFISDLSKMYLKYSDKQNWKTKIISSSITNLGGYKDIIIRIKGNRVYEKLKYESGVHRVQRLPITDNQNRIHTSTCRVAIIKNIKINKLKINDNDLKIDTFKASGAGGQHVNKTNSAVRIKHISTGITVECQNSRSQHENKKEALKIIKSKLEFNYINNKKILSDKKKKLLLGKGNRSEKIRTYNYTKNRITDHRIKLTLNKLNWIMNGNLNNLIKNLKQNLKLKKN